MLSQFLAAFDWSRVSDWNFTGTPVGPGMEAGLGP